ncbi:MAG: phage GP46 family protein [Alphaproteobacteria bacterium]
MTDVALKYDPLTQAFDIAVSEGDLVTDEGLRTAVIVSLFTDARTSGEDDDVPGTDKGGWWGEKLEDGNSRWGSRLWLLRRAKLTAGLPRLVEEWAAEALAWMVDQGVAERVEAVAEVTPAEGGARLTLTVTLHRAQGAQSFVFDPLWENS